MTEYRAGFGEIRGIDESDHSFELRVVTYGQVDTYGSVWEPGVFDDSLRSRKPAACWGHDWTRVIGSMVDHTDTSEGLDGVVRFADMTDVPDARMAWSLLKDGHLRDSSFGFKRKAWSDRRNDNTYAPNIAGEKERIRAARLDEVSPVLVGSVPGTGATSVRSELVPRSEIAVLMELVHQRKISVRDALVWLEDRGDPDGETVSGPPNEGIDAAAQTQHEQSQVPTDDEPPALDIDEESARWALIEAVFDSGNRRAADLEAELRVDTAPKATERLMEYWARGEGAAKINWGVAGDFARCEMHLGKYVKPEQLKGLCANLHHRATGAWPGHAATEQKP